MEDIMPKHFQDSYYQKNIDRCDKRSVNDFRWRSLYKYAMLIKNFYIKLFEEFNNTLDNPIEVPTYVKNFRVFGELETIAHAVKEQEIKLLRTFDNDPSKIIAKCEKHSTLRMLRETGAKCWMMYLNLTRENYYKTIVNYKEKDKEKVKTEDSKTALNYFHYSKAKAFNAQKIKHFFSLTHPNAVFKKVHPETIGVYSGIKAEPLFEEIINTFNGYNFKQEESELNKKIDGVENEIAKRIIHFYKNYENVKRCYKKLIFMANQLESGVKYYSVIDYYNVETGRDDAFILADNYLNELTELCEMIVDDQNYEYLFVMDDIIFLCDKLDGALKPHRELHQSLQDLHKQRVENFKNHIANKN